jgi:hypothetical protein
MMAHVALAGLFAACGNSGGVECRCADPSVFIDVPVDRAPAGSQVVLSGVACAGVVHIPCCTGLYAPALAGATIDVPGAAQDAGSAG